MNKTSKILFRAGALLLILLIAVAMFVVGRGHTVYLDNKTVEYNGQSYNAFSSVEIVKGGKRVTTLNKTERGAVTNIGQNFKITLRVTEEKGGIAETKDISLKLPYSIDGVIINLPAYLSGLPEEAYLEEFVAAPEPDEGDDDIPTGDEFGMGVEDGLSTEG